MAPATWINVAGASHAQLFDPIWAGVGITMGLNLVALGVCGSGSVPNGAHFFSPFQGLDAADPAYQAAYQKFNGKAGDDIGYALWGAEKLLTEMLKAGGKDLSRQSFIAGVNGKGFNTGVYPAVNYGKGRFGGTAMHVLRVDCSARQYKTEAANKSAF
jgi:hypothetical protein